MHSLPQLPSAFKRVPIFGANGRSGDGKFRKREEISSLRQRIMATRLTVAHWQKERLLAVAAGDQARVQFCDRWIAEHRRGIALMKSEMTTAERAELDYCRDDDPEADPCDEAVQICRHCKTPLDVDGGCERCNPLLLNMMELQEVL